MGKLLENQGILVGHGFVIARQEGSRMFSVVEQETNQGPTVAHEKPGYSRLEPQRVGNKNGRNIF